jgi:OMF family outer membrane factor
MRSLLRAAVLVAALVASGRPVSGADEANQPAASGAPVPIDLPTVLRLAGANAVDVQIARERLSAARATATGALMQFLPWLSPGANYRRHGGLIQDVVGNIVTANKDSYALGASGSLQVDVGDALFRTLAARQSVRAADHQVRTQEQEVALRAAQGYFDLLEAQATTAAAAEALEISRSYESQLHRAVEVGIAFKGDELRVRVQAQRNQLVLQQATEQRRIQAARLAEILRLDAAVDLLANDAELAPLPLSNASDSMDALVKQALAARPEIGEAEALLQAATETEKGSVYGPLIPTVSGQLFLGGLGGGKQAGPTTFGASRDYFAAVGWRIGPGGLFDVGRTRLTRARVSEARWNLERLKDSISRQVVEARTRVLSQEQQLQTAKEALATAEETLRLTQARREFEVGVVLENILAEQDQARARQDYARALGEFNKAQYALSRALGRFGGAASMPQSGPVRP